MDVLFTSKEKIIQYLNDLDEDILGHRRDERLNQSLKIIEKGDSILLIGRKVSVIICQKPVAWKIVKRLWTFFDLDQKI